ncbi:MAG TPA: DUF6264 family protein [Terrimesophilobacter sp.]|nr:DUF6264 family protein [Terrimesophilobacter sp.]
MTEQRPRPQYGEYATPQVQAQAMGLPTPAHAVPSVPPPVPDARPADTGHRRQQTNLIVTVTLLALGLVNVGMSVGSYGNLGATIQTVYDTLGYGTYTSGALAASLGIVAIVVSVVVWLVTAAVSALLLRKHRVSWWVPLVGATLVFVAIAIIMTVAVVSDPAFMTYLDTVGS